MKQQERELANYNQKLFKNMKIQDSVVDSKEKIKKQIDEINLHYKEIIESNTEILDRYKIDWIFLINFS